MQQISPTIETPVAAGQPWLGWTQEIEAAREVQERLLYREPPQFQALKYSSCCLPAKGVGGDYCDFIELKNHQLVLAVGDISGKGISAALMMAHLQASVRTLYATTETGLAPLLQSVNRLFLAATAPAHYATLFVGEYDDRSGTLRYANCGHNAPLLVHSDCTVERLQPTATVLGLFENWECSTSEVRLVPGDTLVLFTDGVTEATNANGEEFGEQRLIDRLRIFRASPPCSLVEGIVRTAQEFSGHRQRDDLTVAVARAN